MKSFPSNQTRCQGCHFIGIWFFAITLGLGFCHTAKAETFFLLDETFSRQELVADTPMPSLAGFPASKRLRQVTLTPSVATAEGVKPGDTLVLNLFDDAVLSAVIDRVGVNINGTTMVRGWLAAYPFADFLMSTTNDRTLVSIHIPEIGKHYLIQSESQTNLHYLLELDPDHLDTLDDMPVLVPPADLTEEEISAPQDAPANDPLDPVNIDVMIVYTPAARIWAGGTSGINNVIAQAMQKAELALDNSETALTMTLVHSEEVSYIESGDSSDDLGRLRSTTDGYIDEVHALRDYYGADLVAMFTYISDTGGIGYLLNSASGQPAYGFTISRVQQAGTGYTTIHEWGHNMGCGHHNDQNYQPGPGLFDDYSAGWRWIGSNSGKYCSIMTYESGTYFADGQTHTRVAYFSNPNVFYASVATGDAADGDNARTIRQTKAVISAYRNSAVPSQSPVAQADSVVVPMNTPTVIALQATDDGLPNPPGMLSYIITSLPLRGTLTDPDASEITAVPYTLINHQNEVTFTSSPACGLPVEFTFIANDGGTAPDGGDSNAATLSVSVETYSPPAGDFEPDCDVDFDDLNLLIIYWLQSCGDCQGTDLLADGIVNLEDFSLFAQNWLLQQ